MRLIVEVFEISIIWVASTVQVFNELSKARGALVAPPAFYVFSMPKQVTHLKIGKCSNVAYNCDVQSFSQAN